MINKQEIVNRVTEILESKRKTILTAIKDAQGSANDATKSSAGDKHETSRAMAQLEVERLGNQLNNIKKQILLSNSILHSYKSNGNVQAGSLVTTTEQVFLILTGLGNLKLNEQNILVMAPNAPIAQLMLSKSVGDKIQWMNKNVEILEVI